MVKQLSMDITEIINLVIYTVIPPAELRQHYDRVTALCCLFQCSMSYLRPPVRCIVLYSSLENHVNLSGIILMCLMAICVVVRLRLLTMQSNP